MTNAEKVKEFHTTFKQNISVDTAFTFIQEEYKELADAHVWGNKQEQAKEAGDLLYVVYGYLHALGLDPDRIVADIHESNMSKLGEDGKPIYRHDGKVLKGPNYKPVNFSWLDK